MGNTHTKFQQFEAIDFDTWKQEAEKVLKGRPFEKLLTKTYENIIVKPLYTKDDLEHTGIKNSVPGTSPFMRGTDPLGYISTPWFISQKLNQDDLKSFNLDARRELENGQTVLHLDLSNSDSQKGMSLTTMDDLRAAFSQIPLTEVPLLINAGISSLPFLALFSQYFKEEKNDLSQLTGTIGMDPLNSLVKEGYLPYDLSSLLDVIAFVTHWSKEHTPALRTIIVSSEAYHNGGANAVSELAYTLAAGTEYVNQCLERGLTIHEIARKMAFSFSVGSDFFMEIAKLRAARVIWATIIEAFGGNEEDQKIWIHAQTSTYTKTYYDPYSNMLRSTVEALAGVISGINSLHVTPFNEPHGEVSSLSRRIARNTQLILKEEAFLTQIADPAGGSWYVESLTSELADEAYSLFQAVELHGGLLASLKQGKIQKNIKETAEKRKRSLNLRKDKIVGTNMYVNLDEEFKQHGDTNDDNEVTRDTELLEDLFKSIYTQVPVSDISIEQLMKSIKLVKDPLSIEPIEQHRLTEQFEELRKNAEHYSRKMGTQPKVNLILLGELPSYKARADFAKGFFEAGGFGLVTLTEDEFIEGKELETSACVVCGNDQSYQDRLNVVTSHIEKICPTGVFYLVSKPSDLYSKYQFIHQGTNCYETLRSLQQKMGVIN
ncbi:acyl-CoA mutase large subunit family protein [Litchfieldia alkalitelluris]|uniref:acyl-CoA mutase large subunit family protein n=1 Tax=Litchfieldia alkalitelluris TaxID=304268 RepID=UPI0009977A5C|nr:acyl-CoA mutase large subunit family protein [Litchfieldia alkalitelluris]